MQQYVGVIILLLVSSLLSTIVWFFLNKKGQSIREGIGICFIKVLTFFLFINYFLMSAAKYYLGYHKENLFESFWDIQGRTYIHYGVILVLIGIILPILMHVILIKAEYGVIIFFDAVMFMSLFFTYAIARMINNKYYCIAFIVAVFITVIALWHILNDKGVKKTEDNIIEKLKQVVPVVLLWVMTIIVYIPNELYLNNISDFKMSFSYFGMRILQGSILALTVTLIGAVLLLNKKQIFIFSTILFCLVIMGYVQGMLLNGDMQILDGTAQIWTVTEQAVNFGIWIVAIGIMVIISIYKKALWKKVVRVISIYLVLIQMVSLVVLILTTDIEDSGLKTALTKDSMTEIGAKNNVIVFVLDRFDGLLIDEILEEDSNFLEPLKDFVYYRNATSAYAPTWTSIPFLLTGVDWKEGTTTYEMWKYAYEGDTLLTSIYEQNYDISVYTDSFMVSTSVKDIISNYEDGIKRECKLSELMQLMTQCSKYRFAPFIIKNYYQYDTNDISLLTANDTVYTWGTDLPFYHDLLDRGLRVSEEEGKTGTYKFYHMYGAHPPYTMTEEYQYIEFDAKRDIHIGSQISQSRGSLKIIYEYIDQMKQLGKYEDATIIITADHGHVKDIIDEQGNTVNTSIPILFIKKPYEKNETIVVSEAPVSHDDLICTIQESVGLEADGKTCSEIAEDENRTRTCMFGETLYEINGNVRELSSWSLLND